MVNGGRLTKRIVTKVFVATDGPIVYMKACLVEWQKMGTAEGGLSPQSYRSVLFEKFWEYSRREFSPFDKYFDRSLAAPGRPPVFNKEHASRNVLLRNSVPDPASREVLDAIPEWKRHRWFGSMASSRRSLRAYSGT